MSLLRSVYVSLACLDRRDAQTLVQEIVDHARSANAAAQITGALMFDGSRFAQVLEGPEDKIVRLVDSIASDRRHENVVLIQQKRVVGRLFTGFSMAYSGRSVFVGRSIARTLAGHHGETDDALEQLVRLMLEFTR